MLWTPFILALSLSSCGPDRLETEPGVFGQYSEQTLEIVVANRLLGAGEREVEMVTLPSFDSEEAVYVDERSKKVVWARAKTPISNGMEGPLPDGGIAPPAPAHAADPRSAAERIPIERKMAPIPADVLAELKRAWNLALEAARPPPLPKDENDICIVADGTAYVFADWTRGPGYRTGTTVSPHDGSRMAQLVKLGNELAQFAQAPEGERQNLARTLIRDARAVSRRLQGTDGR